MTNVLVPSYKDQQFRIAREASYAVVPSTGWRRLGSLMVDVQPKFDTEQFTASGDAIPSINILNDDYVEGTFKGKADYESMQYPMSSFYGDAAITTPGGGTLSRQWDWLWNGSDIILPASFACQFGVPASAEQVPGVLFNGLDLKGGRKGMDLSGKFFGQKTTENVALGGTTSELQTLTITGTPTGGTFTLAFKGAVTTPIAYNAVASAVQSALDALPTLQAGQTICAGGPLPGSGVTITFAGVFAGRDVPALVPDSTGLTGGTSPAAVITTTTPGADAATNIAPKPMFPLHFSLYMDPSWGALGSTKLTQTFELAYSLGDKWDRTRPINAAADSDSFVEKDSQKHTVALTMACDAAERAQLAAIRAGQTQFIRIEAVGPIIEAAIPYRFRQDMVAFITDADKGSNMGSVYVRQIKFMIGRDLATNNAMAARVVNTQTAL